MTPMDNRYRVIHADGREGDPIGSSELPPPRLDGKILPETLLLDCATQQQIRADAHPSLVVLFRRMGIAAPAPLPEPPSPAPAVPPPPSLDIPPPATNSWQADRLRLKRWLGVFFLVWLTGAGLWLLGANTPNLIEGGDTALAQTITTIGVTLFLSAIVPYVVSLVFAYRVQDKLNRAGLYRWGAWHVLVGGLILNPWGLGFLLPTRVLLTANKIERAERRGAPGSGKAL